MQSAGVLIRMQVWSYFGMGTQLQELYLSFDNTSPQQVQC